MPFWLDPNVGAEFCAGEAPVKLNPGAPVDPDAPPKAGALLLLPAPKAGVDVALLAPPNWNGLEPPEGAVVAPKLNMPPGADDGVEAALPPSLPEENGLLNDEEAEFPPNWKPNDPPELVEFAPKDEPALLAAGVVEAPPNRGVEVPEPPPNEGAAGAAEAPPKLKMGAAEAPVLPPSNAFLAGDGPSCFMGLPSSAAAPDDVGD